MSICSKCNQPIHVTDTFEGHETATWHSVCPEVAPAPMPDSKPMTQDDEQLRAILDEFVLFTDDTPYSNEPTELSVYLRQCGFDDAMDRLFAEVQAHTERVSKRREIEAIIDELEDVMGADMRLHTNPLLNKRLETLNKTLTDMKETGE